MSCIGGISKFFTSSTKKKVKGHRQELDILQSQLDIRQSQLDIRQSQLDARQLTLDRLEASLKQKECGFLSARSQD